MEVCILYYHRSEISFRGGFDVHSLGQEQGFTNTDLSIPLLNQSGQACLLLLFSSDGVYLGVHMKLKIFPS